MSHGFQPSGLILDSTATEGGLRGLGGADQAAVHARPCNEKSLIVKNLERERVTAGRAGSRISLMPGHTTSLEIPCPLDAQ